ncbi:SDR family NAD(P)-dependent oxidoreductase [Sphingomonas naphthae]|uniref:SDR family NAD(P)-dependent oxidoreductase n=1 Tax=Sphingomonas naphthae TaxID=1813468 RepID=A0ABY7THQ6_9SPHN|nr:SDR family NAD(P)-dependent oxidoreductase [Sphingomonas naphthae]WCT72583.1 SDR family NAD(P)-dependent oxidoreductase [Sphingomonas naphthae]
MVSLPTAVVIGAGGGIGGAFVAALRNTGRYGRIHAFARTPPTSFSSVFGGQINVTNEESIAAAAMTVGSPVDLVLIATGMLHEGGRMPEKALRELDANTLARIFEVNTIGPALALKHFSPLLPKDRRAMIGVISARVGSISDNRSGGWFGYRASKAALNMIVKSAAIEIARSRPEAVCVALHPGTVDTRLSLPFQHGVAPDRLFSPERAARQLLDVIDGLKPIDTGKVFGWDGEEIQP